MDDFQSYLDEYAPGAATMRAALEGRIAPSSHYEAYFNVPFPVLRTGLNGLGDIGQPLNFRIEFAYPTRRGGPVMTDPTSVQRGLNTLLPEGSRLAVDGVAGPQTLRAAFDLWTRWAATPGAATQRAQALREDPQATPYAPRLHPWASGLQTIAVERAFLRFLSERTQVADPPRGTPSTPDPGTPDPNTYTPPAPASSSGTLIAAVAAAVLLGLWVARS